MQKRPLPPGFEALGEISSGAKDIIDQIAKDRKQAGETRRGYVVVVTVMKHPVAHPPRTVATIHLEDGTTHDLTEDAWGKRNYEVNIATFCTGDELKCVYPLLPNKKLILVGSEAGAARL